MPSVTRLGVAEAELAGGVGIDMRRWGWFGMGSTGLSAAEIDWPGCGGAAIEHGRP